MYRKLSYEISTGDPAVASRFQAYVESHHAAATIQAWYKGCRVRRLLSDRGFCSKSGNRVINDEAVSAVQNVLFKQNTTSAKETKPLAGITFVFVGSVPSQGKKKWKQAALEAEAKSLGGTVAKTLPGEMKGKSTKRYYVLISKGGMSKNVPAIVKDAVRRKYLILDYQFLFECIEKRCIVPFEVHQHDIARIYQCVNVEPTLAEKHFKRKPRMISLLKKRKKKAIQPSLETTKVEKNVAIFYANLKRKAARVTGPENFAKQAKRFGQYCKDFSILDKDEQQKYINMWNEKKREAEEQHNQACLVEAHNRVVNPLHSEISANLTLDGNNACCFGLP